MNMKGIEELDLQSLDSKDEHRWQFNGVEKNESFGLNWNETFYRTYDMQLGRWNHIDPKPTYSQTTYMGMGNNPVSYSDALGDTLHIEHKGENIIYTDGNLTWGEDAADGSYKKGDTYNGKALNKKGKLKGFVKHTVNALDKIRTGGDVGNELISLLQNNSTTLYIMQAKSGEVNEFSELKVIDKFSNTLKNVVTWDRSSMNGGLDVTGNTKRPAFIALAHEMAHGLDVINGTKNSDRWFTYNGKGVSEAEKYATHWENQIRAENGIPLREYYTQNKHPYGRIIKNGNESIYYTRPNSMYQNNPNLFPFIY